MAMPVKSRSALSLATMASLLSVSCSATKPIVPFRSCFRLEAMSGVDSLLLTPAIPEGDPATAPIKLWIKSSRVSPSLQCFAEEGQFRIEQGGRDPSSVQITMPSAETWQHNLEVRSEPLSEQATETLFAILADLDRLQGEGCFLDTKISIRDEPLPAGHPLWKCPNLLITPHIGASSPEFARRALKVAEGELRRYMAGEPLRNVVQAAV